jgi:hypothetical protein
MLLFCYILLISCPSTLPITTCDWTIKAIISATCSCFYSPYCLARFSRWHLISFLPSILVKVVSVFQGNWNTIATLAVVRILSVDDSHVCWLVPASCFFYCWEDMSYSTMPSTEVSRNQVGMAGKPCPPCNFSDLLLWPVWVTSSPGFANVGDFDDVAAKQRCLRKMR